MHATGQPRSSFARPEQGLHRNTPRTKRTGPAQERAVQTARVLTALRPGLVPKCFAPHGTRGAGAATQHP
eukprot:6449380-Alexandrium_andersonii.AAC.1